MRSQIAKITKTFLGAGEDTRGVFTANLTVDYGDSSGQRIGDYSFNRDDTGFTAAFIKGVLDAAGVDSWEQLVGRTILVLKESDDWNARVIGIAPLPTERGTQMLFADVVAAHTNRPVSTGLLAALAAGRDPTPVETSTIEEIKQAAQAGKVVLFTASGTMAQALADELGDQAVLVGPNQSVPERQAAHAAFADPDGARVLVTTIHVNATGWHAPAGSVVLFCGTGLPPASSPLIYQAKARVRTRDV